MQLRLPTPSTYHLAAETKPASSSSGGCSRCDRVRVSAMERAQEVLDRFWKTGAVGVGLAGIRERLKELGGTLEIESSLEGTLLQSTIPASSLDEPSSDEGGSALRPSG